MSATPSPSYRITVRVRYANQVGNLARLTAAIAGAGGSVGAVDIVSADRRDITRDITVDCTGTTQERDVLAAMRALPALQIVSVHDRTFQMHHGGKIEVQPKFVIRNRDDLSMAYTPGVARVSEAIAKEPARAFNLTIKQNTVAVVSDGSAVLGLGNIGPLAAMPVMEGKCMLFKEFGKVDAFPICLSTQDPEEIIAAVKAIAPTFGGINLEDISAPRCFVIEERLAEELEIPVFHDDQHGTASVVLAALLNAVKIVRKEIPALKVVVAGAGAAGNACARAMLAAGVSDLIVCDRAGAIYRGRSEHMDRYKEGLAEHTNPRGLTGSLPEALAGADVFLGVSGPNIVRGEALKAMAEDAIVFALANPVPEVAPEDAPPNVRIMATGRSDYPNQINNVLCFPGLFRGLLECSARRALPETVITAAKAIAEVIRPDELAEDYIIPSVFDQRVAPAVAHAVAALAVSSGVSRKTGRGPSGQECGSP